MGCGREDFEPHVELTNSIIIIVIIFARNKVTVLSWKVINNLWQILQQEAQLTLLYACFLYRNVLIRNTVLYNKNSHEASASIVLSLST